MLSYLIPCCLSQVSLPLECSPFPGSHTSVRIVKKTEQLLKRNGISTERVSAMVIDNAANATLAGEMMDFDSVPCTPHTLQLTAKQILEQSSVARLLKVVRKIVGAFKHSGLKNEELRAEQIAVGLKKLRLIQDVRTRWASTYLMLVNFLLNMVPIKVVCMRHQDPNDGARKRARRADPMAADISAAFTGAAQPPVVPAASVVSMPAAARAAAGSRTPPLTTRQASGALARRPGALAELDTSESDDSSSDDGSVDIGSNDPASESDSDKEVVAVSGSDQGSESDDPSSNIARDSYGGSSSAPRTIGGRSSTRGKSKPAPARGRGRGRKRGGTGHTSAARSGKSATTTSAKAKPAGSKRKHDKYMKQLTTAQWHTLQLLKDLLEPFYEAQTQLEGEQYITSSLVPFHIGKIKRTMQASMDSDDADIIEVATMLSEDLNRRWTEQWPRATMLCVALDPRTKKMRCYDAQQQQHAWQLLKADMAAVEKARCMRAAAAAGVQSEQQQSSSSSGGDSSSNCSGGSSSDANNGSSSSGLAVQRSTLDELFGDDSSLGFDETVAAADLEVDAEYVLQQRIESEIKLYKTLPKCGSAPQDNPLHWWREKAQAYPLLAAVARKWLAVPASSAASERMFSSAGLTVTKKRTKLGSDRVATLVFLKTAWPALSKAGVLPGAL